MRPPIFNQTNNEQKEEQDYDNSESDPYRHRRSSPVLRTRLGAELHSRRKTQVLRLLIIPKSDTSTIAAIEKAVNAAIEAGIGKFGGKRPNKAALKLPLRDGDIERDDEAYKGAYFLNANSLTAPQIVDQSVAPILDRAEVYSGCYARVSLSFYAFNTNGNRGIACGLGNIQRPVTARALAVGA